MYLLLLIAYLYSLDSVSAHGDHGRMGLYAECGSGKVNWPIRSGNIPAGTTDEGSLTKAERAKRQALQPIRISPQYVTINISAGVLGTLQAADGPVMNTLNYFQRTLSVVPFTANLRAPGVTMCGPHVLIPADHADPSGAGVDADYIYYITSVNDEVCQGGFIVGFAGACFVAPWMDNRPYIGFVNFCPTAFERFDGDFIKTLSLHETTHALVFTPQLFGRFPRHNNVVSQQRINGKDVSIVTTPKVAQAARDHYNCPTLRGPLLENEGGELSRGSHWESRTLFPELMNAIIYDTLANNTVISRVTLSLFEDSSWYTVNYQAGLTEEELLFGSGQGCGFVTANCNSTSYPYACTPNEQLQCTYDYSAAGVCRQATFFDFCAIVIPGRFCADTTPSAVSLTINVAGDIGPQSICVDNSNRDPGAFSIANCVEHRCVQIQGTELMAFSLTVNGQTEWCYPDGTVNNGELQCPPIRYACARSDIDMLSPTSGPIPPPLCDASCASCNVAQNPAFCQTCATGRSLNGNGPTSCLLDSNPCNGSTYLTNNGGCTACALGCSLCAGPRNSDCLACADTDLYRDTSNRLNSACVTQCGARTTQSVDVFGVRTCIARAGGGGMGLISGVFNTSYISIMVLFCIIATVNL